MPIVFVSKFLSPKVGAPANTDAPLFRYLVPKAHDLCNPLSWGICSALGCRQDWRPLLFFGIAFTLLELL